MSNAELLAPHSRRRRGWLAALLTLVTLGAGHAYAGRALRALVLNVSGYLIIGAAFALLLRGRAGALTVFGPLAIVLAFFVLAAIDAWRSTRKPTPLGRRARWLYVVALVVLSGIAADWYFARLKTQIGDAFRIPSTSMEPTVLVGDYISSAPQRVSDLRRDQLLVWQAPNGSRLHRLIGLPGDTLQMRSSQLRRNGSLVAEPYEHAASGVSDTMPTRTWGPIIVPTDSMFVLGDNLDASYDSRYFGFAPLDSVRGRPVRIYFSRAPDGGIRWPRIGRPIDN